MLTPGENEVCSIWSFWIAAHCQLSLHAQCLIGNHWMCYNSWSHDGIRADFEGLFIWRCAWAPRTSVRNHIGQCSLRLLSLTCTGHGWHGGVLHFHHPIQCFGNWHVGVFQKKIKNRKSLSEQLFVDLQTKLDFTHHRTKSGSAEKQSDRDQNCGNPEISHCKMLVPRSTYFWIHTAGQSGWKVICDGPISKRWEIQFKFWFQAPCFVAPHVIYQYRSRSSRRIDNFTKHLSLNTWHCLFLFCIYRVSVFVRVPWWRHLIWPGTISFFVGDASGQQVPAQISWTSWQKEKARRDEWTCAQRNILIWGNAILEYNK